MTIYSKNRMMKIHRQQGIAIVIVLWMTALMTIMALAYSSMTRTENRLNSLMVHSAQARSIAESGIWLAVNDLIQPSTSRRYPTNNLPTQLQSDSLQSLTISIQDETGKIDLNKASQQLLMGLVQSVGVDQDKSYPIVDAIMDWRDNNDLSLLNGAEDSDYAANGYPYGAKDGPINSVGELLQIHGIDALLYKKLQPLVTIHSMRPRVNINSASIAVLHAIPSLSTDMVVQLISSRADLGNATIPPVISDEARPYISTAGRGNVFSVVSEAQVKGVSSRLRVTFVLKKNGDRPITILEWRENVPPLIHQQTDTQENVSEF